MKFMYVKLSYDKNNRESMLINIDLITRIDANTNFVALADGSELVLTNDSMAKLMINSGIIKGE